VALVVGHVAQAPLQRFRPAEHCITQLLPLALQVAVAPAGTAQGTHALPHFKYPASQVKPQLVPSQVGVELAGAAQAVHDAPQLEGLEFAVQVCPHTCCCEGQVH
jgi:hypothetical protein